jgi:hypothetical protein
MKLLHAACCMLIQHADAAAHAATSLSCCMLTHAAWCMLHADHDAADACWCMLHADAYSMTGKRTPQQQHIQHQHPRIIVN